MSTTTVRTEGYVNDRSLALQRPARQSAPRADFSTAVEAPRSRNTPRVLDAAASAVTSSTPAGMLVNGVVGLVGGASADPRQQQIDDMWRMQAENQAMNLEYMALQESAQSENRHFTAMSNLMKARHDTAKGAISNIRV